MSVTTSAKRPFRALATTTALGVAAAGLALAAPGAPAQAAATQVVDASLSWRISQQFTDHLSTRVLADGATEDAEGVLTFPNGVGEFDAESGATEIDYDGSVSGSFAMAGTTYYTVTVADPTVTIEADGTGEISAVVSASNAAAMGNPAASTEPTRVVVTTFDAGAAEWTASAGVASLTDTPDWAGVIDADSQVATDLGIAAGKPVDGKAFAPSFLGQLTAGLRSHFYASGSGSDVKKSPADFTISAPLAAEPTVEYTATGSTSGVEFSVTGAGFDPRTNPGDDGVYVGLAPAGGLPDVSSMDLSAFAGAAWVSAAQFADDAFSTTFHAKKKALDPRLDYALYTWQAHGHSNATQDTETPVSIDWNAVGFPIKSTTTVTVKAPTTKSAGRASVAVSGKNLTPGGKVTITFKAKGKLAKVWTKKLNAAGKTAIKLPKSKKGKASVKVAYKGDAAFKASTASTKVTIKK